MCLEENDIKPRAIQIISIGTEQNAHAFTFQEDNLNLVLSKIPRDCKVSVVSIVGAFRTGKSFLLSWFLNYLSYHHNDSGNNDEHVPWYYACDTLEKDYGFHWRGGPDSYTTGIWIWSEPFFLNNDLAVILVDTQGMFDHDTTMDLTASIFGISTLLSSYQIYNVSKNIQEDNLQHLALFSEYGRAAFNTNENENIGEEGKVSDDSEKLFQRIEFLIRDWQNFKCDGDGNMDDLMKEMDDYLQKILSKRDAPDLNVTRNQIHSCFDEISCFMFTHPGFEVTSMRYEGSTRKIDPRFLRFMSRFCERVFRENLKPKKIHGREISAGELGAYVRAYTDLFSREAHFPRVDTLLNATAEANNFNAIEISFDKYVTLMHDVATSCPSMTDLIAYHRSSKDQALESFDQIVKFGSQIKINESRRKLEEKFEEFKETLSRRIEEKNTCYSSGYATGACVGVAATLFMLLTKR